MTALAIFAALLALGFTVEELPDMLERQRLAREAESANRTKAAAVLALAIDAKWAKFGCDRGMTDDELARARAATSLASASARRGLGNRPRRAKVAPSGQG